MSTPLSIVQALSAVPLGFLEPRLDSLGPYGPGNHVNDVWSDGGTIRNVSDTFGVVIQGGAGPGFAPQLGYELGFSDGSFIFGDKFNQRIVQLGLGYQLRTGAWVLGEATDVFIVPFTTRWLESLPGRVFLYVAPTWSVELYYLITI